MDPMELFAPDDLYHFQEVRLTVYAVTGTL